jgi:hypothetical protein
MMSQTLLKYWDVVIRKFTGGKWGRGKGGEMTQTLYAYMNKRKKKKI